MGACVGPGIVIDQVAEVRGGAVDQLVFSTGRPAAGWRALE